MKARCFNPKNDRYQHYGARGITVCKRWMKFENFLKDMGEPPIGTVLDRKNNNLGYSKRNCRWSSFRDSTENRINTIWIGGERVMDMAKRIGIPASRIYQRLKLGWTKFEIEQFNEP